MEPRCEGLLYEAHQDEEIGFPPAQSWRLFFSRQVASLEFSSRNHSAKMETVDLKEKPGGQIFIR